MVGVNLPECVIRHFKHWSQNKARFFQSCPKSSHVIFCFFGSVPKKSVDGHPWTMDPAVVSPRTKLALKKSTDSRSSSGVRSAKTVNKKLNGNPWRSIPPSAQSGTVPVSRHSHTACAWNSNQVIV